MTKSKRSTKHDELFQDIDLNMEMDKSYPWDEFAAEFLHIEPIAKNGLAYNKDREHYLTQRSRIMTAVNYLARSWDKEWQIHVIEYGKYIQKTSKNKIVKEEMDRKVRKLFASFDSAINIGTWIMENESIPAKNKKMFKPLLDGAYGLKTILIGNIQGAKEIDKETKQKLIAYADIQG